MRKQNSVLLTLQFCIAIIGCATTAWCVLEWRSVYAAPSLVCVANVKQYHHCIWCVMCSVFGWVLVAWYCPLRHTR